MKLWRLTTGSSQALDGAGSIKFGTRYASNGNAVVSFTTEAAPTILVTLRYLMNGHGQLDDDWFLGWICIDHVPERVPGWLSPNQTIAFVDDWLVSCRCLTMAIASAVLPEADVVLVNPLHPDMQSVPPLTSRSFNFAECLHRPPMLDRYSRLSEEDG